MKDQKDLKQRLVALKVALQDFSDALDMDMDMDERKTEKKPPKKEKEDDDE